jgi:hypothetical protein
LDFPTNDDDEPPDLAESDDGSNGQSLVDDGDIHIDQRNDNEEPPPVTTRSGRRVKPPARLIESCITSADKQGGGFKVKAKYDYGHRTKGKVLLLSLNQQLLLAMKWNQVVDMRWSPDLSAMNIWMEEHTDPEHNMID